MCTQSMYSSCVSLQMAGYCSMQVFSTRDAWTSSCMRVSVRTLYIHTAITLFLLTISSSIYSLHASLIISSVFSFIKKEWSRFLISLCCLCVSLCPSYQFLNHFTVFHELQRLEDVPTQYYIPQQQHGWRANLLYGTPLVYILLCSQCNVFFICFEGSNLYALNGTFRHGQ